MSPKKMFKTLDYNQVRGYTHDAKDPNRVIPDRLLSAARYMLEPYTPIDPTAVLVEGVLSIRSVRLDRDELYYMRSPRYGLDLMCNADCWARQVVWTQDKAYPVTFVTTQSDGNWYCRMLLGHFVDNYLTWRAFLKRIPLLNKSLLLFVQGRIDGYSDDIESVVRHENVRFATLMFSDKDPVR